MDVPEAGNRMKTARLMRVIKKANRKARQTAVTAPPIPSRNRWSGAVRSWIAEFKDRDRSETTPAFDSLFNDASPPPGSETDSSSS
jgi:hypothetical protein